MVFRHFALAGLGALLLATASLAAPVQPVPYRVAPLLADAAEALSPAAVRMDGWLGQRIDANESHRLLVVDTVPLLAGYHQKPGSHPWIGEHVGKWLHAATLAWANSGDAALKAKLDRVAAELIACQEPDGYLGTYLPEKRFGQFRDADWDVWSHKYNLIGLLAYYQYTGNEAALTACRRMGDLLIRTFPAQKSILAAGTHVGMAATSVLEPMVLLYRQTGDTRYLDFARYIVRAWDEPRGPKILSTLLAEKAVNKVANGKAYEMLSNLVGLCELARATGDRRLLETVTIAWEDIALKRLYLTGSASAGEHFHGDFELPNRPSDNICETCVTTTWIQLNWQLLRLTGEARYGQELERAFYNHLAAAQNPRGDDWCYYTPLEGRKPYDAGITCCHSSGPRAMALAPLAAYFKIHDGPLQWDALAVSTVESSSATLELGGQAVTVEQRSEFPRRGCSELTLRMARPARFALRIRIPFWSRDLNVHAPGEGPQIQDGWAVLPARQWQDGDRLSLEFDLVLHLIRGEHGNTGLAAWAYGPFVLAYDQTLNPGLPATAAVKLAGGPPLFTLLPGGKNLVFTGPVAGPRPGENLSARFVPFADAGAGGGTYRVWLRAPWAAAVPNESLFTGGQESQSRKGNLGDGISDGDPGTLSDTYDGRPAAQAWFAVTQDTSVTLKRVVFMHGRSFHDGGWFDASAGKPRVQVLRRGGGEWETIGELGDYPATTATNNGRLKAGEAFTLRLAAPVAALGVRVIGAPAKGDTPRQAFATCAELQAFAE